jgi:pimeloyl-ACP methyl ester carboxylesterase
MTEQEWVLCNNKRICAVINYNGEDNYPFGIIFFPGFSQTKAGAYCLFSQICSSLNRNIPTLRFDYFGYGDSEGEMYEVDLESMIFNSREMLSWFATKVSCKRFIFIGHGIGNYVAAVLAENNPDTEAILITPQLNALSSVPEYGEIINKIIMAEENIDTGAISVWDKNMDDFFSILGGRMNRSKGIIVKRKFLLQLVKFDLKKYCNKQDNIYVLMQNAEKSNDTYDNQMNDYRIEDVLLLDMLEREKVIKNICYWCNSK